MELPSSTEAHRLSVQEFDTTKLLTHAAAQATERRYKEFLIVDIDSHHQESEHLADIYTYIDDPVIRQTALSFLKTMGRDLMPGRGGYQDMAGRITRSFLRRLEKTADRGAKRNSELALRWMDAMGVDYTCLFPGNMLSLGLHPQIEIEAALAEAYNRWLCERILAHEKRLVSMLYLPFNDPEASYRIVTEFADKPGVVGFLVTSVRYNSVHDNAYMRLYSALEERGKPLAFHAAYNWDSRYMEQMNRFISVHALGFPYYNMLHMTNWIINGLPERFPKLKLMWIEGGVAWISFLMQRLDNEYMMRSSEAPLLKRLPSDYMREMYYATQPMELVRNRKLMVASLEAIDADTQLCFSTDYPHWDFDLPSTVYDLPFLSSQAKRNILGRNAAQLFGIDARPWKKDAASGKMVYAG
jgi:predicted TIM-barrel fold metal-dependent hydrolase